MKTALIISLAAAGLAVAYALQQKRRADILAAGAATDLVTKSGLGAALNAFGFSY